ncbi:MAG: 3-hydroxyacyl-CoA dehydrogenase NAD-binding domain-containing protein [Gammaproteobacteria bacterium]|nr:3-hydroxyacyl-CoA dehydrogenase NAD-binding domain-containing protein [Gammaproteobacteria bacterium]
MATNTVAALGAGVIGASWTALFLANGLRVQVYDPADPDGERLGAYIDNAWPTLTALGLTDRGDRANYQLFDSAAAAVDGAEFIQESVPERLDLKHALYAEIEPALLPGAIVASSASGLLVREMQQGWRDPSRFILGHPFNPPHLIPLVELLANEATAPGVLETAEAFYRGIGKITIRVNKEVPAHVANRLQAALWREAISLVQNGVASVEDVDKAVWAGPGLRWAAMGPHMLFHLGAGPGGLGEFCDRYRDSFHRWWDDLDDLRLDDGLARQLFDGVVEEAAGRPVESVAAERDALIVEFLRGRQTLAENG